MRHAARCIASHGVGCHVVVGHVHRRNLVAQALYRRLGFGFFLSKDPQRLVIRLRMDDFLGHPIISRLCGR